MDDQHICAGGKFQKLFRFDNFPFFNFGMDEKVWICACPLQRKVGTCWLLFFSTILSYEQSNPITNNPILATIPSCEQTHHIMNNLIIQRTTQSNPTTNNQTQQGTTLSYDQSNPTTNNSILRTMNKSILRKTILSCKQSNPKTINTIL